MHIIADYIGTMYLKKNNSNNNYFQLLYTTIFAEEQDTPIHRSGHQMVGHHDARFGRHCG